jgi:hypothetical protein
MVHHQQMIRNRIENITITMAGGGGGIGTGTHFLVENAIPQRLHRIYFIGTCGKAHAQIARAQFRKAGFRRYGSVLVDWHPQSRLRAAQFRGNPRVTNRARPYRADWGIAKTAGPGMAKARETQTQAIGF